MSADRRSSSALRHLGGGRQRQVDLLGHDRDGPALHGDDLPEIDLGDDGLGILHRVDLDAQAFLGTARLDGDAGPQLRQRVLHVTLAWLVEERGDLDGHRLGVFRKRQSQQVRLGEDRLALGVDIRNLESIGLIGHGPRRQLEVARGILVADLQRNLLGIGEGSPALGIGHDGAVAGQDVVQGGAVDLVHRIGQPREREIFIGCDVQLVAIVGKLHMNRVAAAHLALAIECAKSRRSGRPARPAA